MSKVIVLALKGSVMKSIGLIERFIEVCPENIWKETSGGWPIWQQVYHCTTVMGTICASADNPAPAFPMPMEVGRLMVQGQDALSKEAVAKLLAQGKACAEKYIDALNDADLGEKNNALSAVLGVDVNHAASIAMLGSHGQYHLGSCDAALRNQGLPGVF